MEVTIHSYPQEQLPAHWYYQIISFLRIMWPGDFRGENQYRNWISNPDDKPVSILFTINDILVAHIQVLSKIIVHHAENYKLYGLTGVFVYPAFQKHGFGKKIAEVGLQKLLGYADVDIAMITCEPHNKPFYEKLGWQFADCGILIGHQTAPSFSDELVSYRFISAKAKSHQASFETDPLYFGKDLW